MMLLNFAVHLYEEGNLSPPAGNLAASAARIERSKIQFLETSILLLHFPVPHFLKPPVPSLLV